VAGFKSESPAGLRRNSQRWAKGLLARVHPNVAVVALADKLARICWAVLRSRQGFSAKGAPVTA
jgi:hypothetical protein